MPDSDNQPVELRAGPLSLRCDRASGLARTICYGNVEILRGIYAAVRDPNWGTVEPVIHDWQLEEDPQSFRLSFRAECRRDDIDFGWTGTIEGSSDGRLRYTMEGVARSKFQRSRIGFCVLHPLSCAGLACQIEHVDGAIEQSEIPELIAPDQPFKEVRAITHQPQPGLSVEVRLEGDTFETEDQRNWTDASYKTYCTPLEIPFPVEIKAGTRIGQTITVTITDERKQVDQSHVSSRSESVEITVEKDSARQSLPEIGLGSASHDELLTDAQAERLRILAPAHVRADVEVDEADATDSLRKAVIAAVSLNATLEIAIHLTDKAKKQLHTIAELVRQHNAPVARWLIFRRGQPTTQAAPIELARQILKPVVPNAPIIAGTDAYFAELNRNRPPVDLADGVCYSINPQVHAFDAESLVETLQAQAETVRSTLAFASGKPISVTPVTLLPRFNPNAMGPPTARPPGELPIEVDPRQPTRFVAAWTLGSIKYLAESGVASITYYETTGWRGVLELDSGPALPERFPSVPGGVFPVFHVLADVNEFRGGSIVRCQSSDPLAAEAVFLQTNDRRRVLVANMSTEETTVQIGPAEGRWTVRRMNAATEHEATTQPEAFRSRDASPIEANNGCIKITLTAYEIATLDQ